MTCFFKKNKMDKTFIDTLELLQDKVKKNCKVVTPDNLGKTNNLLHIAKQKFKILTPNISKRSAPSEDNTIPRIHTSDCILGCILGYAQTVSDIGNADKKDKYNPGDFLGGYYIYSIPFKYALAPNTKLVYDSNVTNEKWLITYDQETITYQANIIGKIVVDYSKAEVVDKDFAVIKNYFCIQISEPFYLSRQNKISGTKDIYLEPGFYSFCVNERKATVEDIKQISKQDFDIKRQTKASLLSNKENNFNKW